MKIKQTKYDGVRYPKIPPRPPGVTRQENRRHFREAMKIARAQATAQATAARSRTKTV